MLPSVPVSATRLGSLPLEFAILPQYFSFHLCFLFLPLSLPSLPVLALIPHTILVIVLAYVLAFISQELGSHFPGTKKSLPRRPESNFPATRKPFPGNREVILITHELGTQFPHPPHHPSNRGTGGNMTSLGKVSSLEM